MHHEVVPPIVGKHNRDVLTPEPLPQQRALKRAGGEGGASPLRFTAVFEGRDRFGAESGTRVAGRRRRADRKAGVGGLPAHRSRLHRPAETGSAAGCDSPVQHASLLFRPMMRHCPILGRATSSTPTPFSRGKWTLVRCAETGFVYLPDPPSYDALAGEHAWESTFATERARRRREEPVVSAVGSWIQRVRRRVFRARNPFADIVGARLARNGATPPLQHR